MSVAASLIATTMNASTPLLLAALGILVAERSGVLNLGVEGIMLMAAIMGVDPGLYEAAELDGANRWQQFWHITLPQLRPTTFFVVIMLTISGFKVYDQMYMITQGGPGTATMTLVYYIYNVAFVNTPKYGYASAIAMVLFVLVLIVTIIQFRGSKGEN